MSLILKNLAHSPLASFFPQNSRQPFITKFRHLLNENTTTAVLFQRRAVPIIYCTENRLSLFILYATASRTRRRRRLNENSFTTTEETSGKRRKGMHDVDEMRLRCG